jgi:hypothetical protein
LKNLKREDDWDALSFDHPHGYYDICGLSKIPYILSYYHPNDKNFGPKFINKIIKNCNKNDLIIPCWSAFNGFAIYKTKKFINCYYDGKRRYDYIPKQLLIENIKAVRGFDMINTKKMEIVNIDIFTFK